MADEVSLIGEPAEVDYEVELILKKRIRQGSVEYYLKWKNFPMEDCTWEPRDSLAGCDELIEEFERTYVAEEPKASKRGSGKRKALDNDILESIPKIFAEDASFVDPYEKDFEAQEILEVSQKSGKLCFRVKWRDNQGSDWVTAEVANKRFPLVILRYYQLLLNPSNSYSY